LAGKKWLGMAIAAGLVGGVILGAYQVSYADVKEAVEQIPFVKKKEDHVKRKELVIQKVSAYLGVSQTELEKWMNQYQVHPRQLAVAAVIAKKSGQPLPAVLEELKDSNLKRVIEKHRLEPKQIKAEMNRLFPQWKRKNTVLKNHPALLLEGMAAYLGRSPEEVRKAFYASRVHPKGALFAAALSKASGKSLEEVLALKQEKKSWREVIQALGVPEDKVKEEMKRLRETMKRETNEWRAQWKEEK